MIVEGVGLAEFILFCVVLNKILIRTANVLDDSVNRNLTLITIFISNWNEYKLLTPEALHTFFDALHDDLIKNKKIMILNTQQAQIFLEGLAACVVAASSPLLHGKDNV